MDERAARPDIRLLILIPVLAAALLAPALVFGAAHIDAAEYDYVWTRQFGQELARGVLYPRWLPGSFRGLGSPTFYFYPPLAYYVSGGLQALGLPTLYAVSGSAWAGLTASGLSMTLWLRHRGASAWWALLYMAAPYHLVDWYVRAALSEFWAYAWLPLIALAINAQPKRWAGPLLALSYAGLIVTHLPMALLASGALILPLIFVHRAYFAHHLGFLALGIGLAAIYLLPALTLQDHTLIATMWRPYFRASTWTLWGPHPPVWALPAAAAAIALCLPGPRFWRWLTIGAAAMALCLVPIVWDAPIIRQVQFPWRLLAVVEFAAITAVALRGVRSGALAAAVLLALSSWIFTGAIAWRALRAPYPATIDVELPDAREYLPAGSDPRLVDDGRRLDLSRVAPATLGPRWPPEAILGAYISLGALLVLGGVCVRRHRAGDAART